MSFDSLPRRLALPDQRRLNGSEQPRTASLCPAKIKNLSSSPSREKSPEPRPQSSTSRDREGARKETIAMDSIVSRASLLRLPASFFWQEGSRGLDFSSRGLIALERARARTRVLSLSRDSANSSLFPSSCPSSLLWPRVRPSLIVPCLFQKSVWTRKLRSRN